MKTVFRLTVAAVGLAIFNLCTTMVQAQFNYVASNSTIIITGYTGPGGSVTIPPAIEGLPVTTIGDNAFMYCYSLTSITLPNSIVKIGDNAFWYCTRLSSAWSLSFRERTLRYAVSPRITQRWKMTTSRFLPPLVAAP